MKKGTTLLLKTAVFLIGTPILALCIYGLLLLGRNPVNSNYVHILYPIIVGMYVTVIPFYYALYHAFKLLTYIDKNEAFSELSVKALTKIKYCAFAISITYVVILPFIYILAEKDDAPGVILIGMVTIFASIVIAFFAAVLQRLLLEAIDIKSENDLTV
ncbi:hypothetical protein BKP37_01435 [Anaerobacillus alkalilacustris]|uniref:DUF2975 domain-containing protein n=1 Tax=Anaerobacillus alkalilacustris TaxID=393763 RepID=A0A1S2LXI2_9BACI|nr:DUF2975 domain-containing protein [Anaerobacillus alkalilacustris]OIJ17219.1 hypothetical protein BKP37_01435 [Anaerobacillus alkalilacustris]